MNNPIKIQKYDKNWPLLYKKESTELYSLLNGLIKCIYHIGSTSIPNMPSKPMIDMLIEVSNIDEIYLIEKKLLERGYENVSRDIIPFRSFLTKRESEETYYLIHFYEVGDPQVQRHLRFKNYLLHDTESFDVYANLKLELARSFTDDILSYVCGKSRFVKSIDYKAKIDSNSLTAKLSEPNKGYFTKDWTQEQITHAIIANLNLMLTHYAQYDLTVEFIRIPKYVLVNTKLPNRNLNHILDTHSEVTDATIRQVINDLTSTNTPFSWWVFPTDQMSNLSKRLSQLGLNLLETKSAIYLDLDKWQSKIEDNIQIKKVTNQNDLKDLLSLLDDDTNSMTTSLERTLKMHTADDPIEFYVGYKNNIPISHGILVYYSQIVGLYQYPSKGACSLEDELLMKKCLIRKAKDQDYHMITTLASSSELPNYLALGFKINCEIERFTNSA